MDVKQLRIGNNITMPFLGNPIVEVIGIAVTEDGTFIQSKHNKCTFFESPEKYKGVELDFVILEKIGFVKNDLIFTHKSGHIIEFDWCNEIYCFYLAELGGWFNQVQYLHELQNLYYALKYVELQYPS